ncbi:hypothetical protein HYV86_07455 [Candidatus Woesearchaeota archaeon]|nr:hypothetical protein [Candidatus Woesearchaeota archaeon]
MDTLLVLGIGLGGLIFIGGILLIHHRSTPKRLQRLLQKVQLSTSLDPSSLLKEEYLEMYGLYLKLPEKHKPNFYAQVIAIRTILEDQLKAQKRLEVLVTQIDSIDQPSKKELLDEIENNYRKLSEKEKEKYTASVMHLRESVPVKNE